MRIGFFTDRYYPQTDGVGVSVDMFAHDLRKLGHTVYIFCPKGSYASKHSHSDHVDGPDVIRFPSIPGIWFEGYRDTFPWTKKNMNMIEDLNLDIVHIHTPGQVGMLGMYVAKSFGLPLVTTYHTDLVAYSQVYKRAFPGAIGLSFLLPIMAKDKTILRDAGKVLRPERTIPLWNAKIIQRMITVMHNNCDLVIAVSEKSRRQLKSYKTKTPIEVLPTGIDWTEIRQPTNYNLRKQFSLPADATILLYVGRIGVEKNLELAIRALQHILPKAPYTYLVLAGPGSTLEIAKFKALASELKVEDHVVFTGVLNRSEVMGAFASSNIFVFPSIADTQGLVINEACAFGKPIVYVDDKISSLTQNNHNGYHAKNNARDFAVKCLKLIEDPELCMRFGKASGKLALSQSGEGQAKKLLSLYTQIAKPTKP